MKLMKLLEKPQKFLSKMKKLFLSLLLVLPLLMPQSVMAKENAIASMDIKCTIDAQGTGTFTETWDMNVSSGTEVYKTFNQMKEKKLSIISVSDGHKTYKNIGDWDVDASRSEKAYKCGINETDSGYELCFGIGNYGHKTYTMKYKITHLVNKYKDAYAINYAFMSDMSIDVGKATVLIASKAQRFSAAKDKIWGFGYDGRCDFMQDGKIYMTTNGRIHKLQLLAKLSHVYGSPDTSYSDQSWKDVYDDAMEGASFSKKENDNVSYEMGEASDDENDWLFFLIFGIIVIVALLVIIYKIIETSVRKTSKDHFDDGSVFDPKEVHPFRDIPTKDINYFYYLAYQMGIAFKDGGIMSAYVLKWIKDEQIQLTESKEGLFKKQTFNIDFHKPLNTENKVEKGLYEMFRKAAGANQILETKEFDRYCRDHYEQVRGFFGKALAAGGKVLTDQHLRIKRDYKKVLCFDIDTNHSIYPTAIRDDMEHIMGLKKFLLDQHNMEEKKAIEVHLWQEYLMYASILGIADEVEKQLKNIQPHFYSPESDYYAYFRAWYIMDTFIPSGITSANHAYTTANSGSAFAGGGGGASFGGGGGGFSGGGGGGVR